MSQISATDAEARDCLRTGGTVAPGNEPPFERNRQAARHRGKGIQEMTRFLVSEQNPSGYRLEDILHAIRTDVIMRCTMIMNDPKDEARHVLDNNMKILNLLSDAIGHAQDSTRVLNKAFGPSVAADGGSPRIGSG